MTKGRNTFEGYQQEKQVARESLISEYLSQLEFSPGRFPHVTALAEDVALHLKKRQGIPCNRATLLRNGRYRAMLELFHAAGIGGGIQKLKRSKVGDDKSKVLIASAELQAANLRRENERLKQYISHLESTRSESPTFSEKPSGEDMARELNELTLKFTRTCQTLQELLRHGEKSLGVNLERRQIVDLTRIRDNVVVDAKLAEPFFEWLHLNGRVGT